MKTHNKYLFIIVYKRITGFHNPLFYYHIKANHKHDAIKEFTRKTKDESFKIIDVKMEVKK